MVLVGFGARRTQCAYNVPFALPSQTNGCQSRARPRGLSLPQHLTQTRGAWLVCYKSQKTI